MAQVPNDNLLTSEATGRRGPAERLLAIQRRANSPELRSRTAFTQYVTALAVIALVTLAAFFFTPLVGAHATALVFLLAVVVVSLFVGRGPALAAAALSAICWEFFFLPPFYAFRINRFEDAMLFGMYFVVALVLGHLTTRIRAQEEAERQREARATALYLLARDLNESVDLSQMVERTVQQLGSCFGAKVAVLLPEENGLLKPQTGGTLTVPEDEQTIPRWVLEHRERAGRFTNNMGWASSIFMPLMAGKNPLGVLGLRLSQGSPPGPHEQELLEVFSQQIAMALERRRLNAISEKAKLLAESERLSKTLLDSMSHEIRTPIAAIQSATGTLAQLSNDETQVRQEMINELQEATARLNRLVGNVLEAGRLESGAVKPRPNECDLRELVQVVLAEAEKDLRQHKVQVNIEPGMPVVPLDFVLIQQALANLVSNCAQHTPAGTLIEVSARLEGQMAIVSVADRGPGIPSECLGRVFEKFFRLPNSRTGGSGLGLSLVKGFVEAHGGYVTAENRPGGGSLFTMHLPAHVVPTPQNSQV